MRGRDAGHGTDPSRGGLLNASRTGATNDVSYGRVPFGASGPGSRAWISTPEWNRDSADVRSYTSAFTGLLRERERGGKLKHLTKTVV